MPTCGSCGAPLPENARFCPACGAEATSAVRPDERKVATVLFADIVGSTALASDTDPERVRAVLERFYASTATELERTGGTVESFAGDAVMAVFGAPTALEDHAERALHAALAIRRRLADDLPQLQVRIGVNTGDVVVGATREGGAIATGDAVNVCKRLEQAAAPGEVLAGERTVVGVRGAFVFGDSRTVAGKGKPDGIVCRPVMAAAEVMRPRGRGLPRVFVGRDPELELLRATYRRVVAHGAPHLVTIVGEPGVGKSRLILELWDVLARETDAPIIRSGRCLPYGDGITYWPIGELIREQLDLHDAPPEEAVGKLAGREILGLALGRDVGGVLHPLDARERLHEATVRLLEDIAAPGPAAVLLEDLHWAEADLLDLVERIAGEARAPLLLLATARPELFERRPGWAAGRRNATAIWLDPLSIMDVTRLLDEIVPSTLPESLRTRVVDRAGGNPFFLEELVGTLADAGLLDAPGIAPPVGHDQPFAMPDTVHAVLAARIDRLPDTEKAALQAAAVVGRVFTEAPVNRLLDGALPNLDLLEERDLIRRTGAGSGPLDREYAIKHALTREVAYTSIPKARRGRLHATLAEWLEQRGPAKEEPASLLAYHYYESVRPDDADLVWSEASSQHERLRRRAVHWLARAGALALGRHELDEAVQLLTRAVEVCDDAHETALLWRRIGEAEALRYDGESMRTALQAALAGPLDDAERADTYAFLAFQASIRSAMWSIRLNRHLIEGWAAEAIALAGPRDESRLRALLALANVEPAQAGGVLPAAVELAEELGNTELRAYAYGALSHEAFESGRLTVADAWTARRLELTAGIENPDHLCEAYEAAVPVLAAMCRFDDARGLAALHLDVARRLSPHHRVHAVSLELELAEAAGDWSTIVERTDRVWEAVSANLSTPCVRNPRDLLLCGLAYLCTGDESRAAELEDDASRIAAEGYDSYLASPRLRLALVRGDRNAVEALLELPVERACVWGSGVFATWLDALVALRHDERIRAEAPRFAQPGTILEPFALRALGAAAGDQELLDRANGLFDALGLDWHRKQTDPLLAGLA